MKGILYYTNNLCEERIANTVRLQLARCCNGMELVSVSQYPLGFGNNIALPLESSILSMFKQIMVGLKSITSDIVFMVEHDVIYHPSHFDFTPQRNDIYYFNRNMWAVDSTTGQAMKHGDMRRTSGLVAYRSLLVSHYEKKLAKVLAEGFTRHLGFEPGKPISRGGVDDYGYECYESKVPLIDINHDRNIRPKRFNLGQYTATAQRQLKDSFVLSDSVPYWGRTKDCFPAFIRRVYDGTVGNNPGA